MSRLRAPVLILCALGQGGAQTRRRMDADKHAVPVIKLGRTRRLVSFSREKDSRSNGYVVSDRFGAALFATQCLPLAAAYINSLQSGDAVSAASLYEAASKPRLVHRRWSVRKTKLDALPEAFEAQRRAQPDVEAAVLGHPHRIQVTSSDFMSC